LLLVDLDHPEADMAALFRELAQLRVRPRVAAYGPHVKEHLLTAAAEAGCDIVLSRGEFHAQFTGSLLRWLEGTRG
jgi:hypothetical protein